MTELRRSTRLAAALAVSVAFCTSCSVDFDDGQISFVDDDVQLLCAEGGSLTLAAQAVPTASHIPCVADLPAGWSVDYSYFDNDGVEIKIDSRRAPIDDLIVAFAETCGTDVVADSGAQPIDDLGDAAVIPEGFDATVQVDGLHTLLRVVGPGGCTEIDIELDADEPVSLEDFPTINWVDRAALDAGIADSTDNRLRLDP